MKKKCQKAFIQQVEHMTRGNGHRMLDRSGRFEDNLTERVTFIYLGRKNCRNVYFLGECIVNLYS